MSATPTRAGSFALTPLYLLSLFSILFGCSESARSLRAVSKAQSLLSKGDRYLEQGSAESADKLYKTAEAVARQAEESAPERSSLAQKAKAIRSAASHRALSIHSPEGSVLSIINAMRAGSFDDFRLMADFESMTITGVGEERWGRLTAEQKKRMVTCVQAGIKHWLEFRNEYLRPVQQTVEDVKIDGDEALVTGKLRTPVTEITVLYDCRRFEAGWKVSDFRMVDLDSRLTDYVQQAVDLLVEDLGSLETLLARPDMEELAGVAYEKAERALMDMDQSLVGKTVTLSSEPLKTFEVIKHTQREDGEWLLVRLTGGDESAVQWVKSEEAEVVRADAALWGMD